MDYYEILELTKEANQEEIKKSYQQLLLKNHPDKSSNQEEALNKYLLIDKAYKVLKDPSLRKEYDSIQFQESSRCNMIVHDTIEKSDFIFNETEEIYYSICKCGGWYILDEEFDDEKELILCCDECSLVIKVISNKEKSNN